MNWIGLKQLRAAGFSIGANDTWIAATAITADMRLLTRNQGHFQRISEVQIESYDA